jgi:hypothetical protein
MLVVEADASRSKLAGYPARNFGLTNSATELSWKSNDDINSQGNYDYDAHAQVYLGGADPLGSQGYASVARHPSSSLDAARGAKSSRAFLFMGVILRASRNRNLEEETLMIER